MVDKNMQCALDNKQNGNRGASAEVRVTVVEYCFDK